MLHRAVRKQAGYPLQIELLRHEAGRDQGADFAGEKQAALAARQIKRLNAHRIARQQQSLRAGIVEGEGVHPLQSADAIGSPARQRVQENFGIAVSEETRAGS